MSESYDESAILYREDILAVDKDGFPAEKITYQQEVFVAEKSVERSEFYAAARDDIKVSMKLTVRREEFEDFEADYKKLPTHVLYQEKKYEIVRTFSKEEKEETELYLKEV